MKIVRLIVSLNFLLLAGCAAIILSVGEEEWSVVNESSTYASIAKITSSKPEIVLLNPALSIRELKKKYSGIDVLVRAVPSKTASGPGKFVYPDVVASKFSTFEFVGRIERNHAVGGAIALSGYTIFLAELFMVPVAISHQLKAHESVHTIDVWFDETEKVVSYIWSEKIANSM